MWEFNSDVTHYSFSTPYINIITHFSQRQTSNYKYYVRHV